MRAFLGSPISSRLAWTPEGFLICRSVVLCRCGEQTYTEGEIFENGGSRPVVVHRDADDVLSDEHIASLEGKPVTSPHPATFLSPSNIMAYQRGHVQNIRRGKLASGEDCLIGDLLITDRQLAEDIVAGNLREVSTGYECSYTLRDDGHVQQADFRGNHIAIVPAARANVGRRVAEVKIMDDAGETMTEQQALAELSRICKALGIESEPRTDAEIQQVFDGIRDMNSVLARALDYPSKASQEYASECYQYHRGQRIGVPDVAILNHDSKDCRPSLRRERQVADAKPKTAAEDSAEYARSLRKFHRV
jgi:hypothetical protein